MTKWGFRCHRCGRGWELMHGKIAKEAFVQPKKVGRPRLNCGACNEMCVGEMKGS